jgi:small subunit ribosomal protein S17
MADKPDNENTEEPKAPDDAAAETTEAPEADAATETPEAQTSEAPEADAAAETPEAQASEAPEADAAAETPADEAPDAAAAETADAEAPEADAEEAPAAEATDEPAQAPEASAPASPPAEQLPPKERRRKARSAHSGETRPARTPEQRHADRVEERRTKAVRRRARRLQERAKATERRAAAPAPEALAPVHAPVEGKRKVRQGVVVSNKAEKTITVRIDVARRHRRYEKIVRSSNTVHAHDENNDAREGDVVRVIESRPLSHSKRWALVDVLERAR